MAPRKSKLLLALDDALDANELDVILAEIDDDIEVDDDEEDEEEEEEEEDEMVDEDGSGEREDPDTSTTIHGSASPPLP
jgi:hypothetical protein